MSILGKNIKALLKTYRLKQYQLAKEIGVYPGRISEYINNKYTPDYDTLKKIADFFNVTVDSLLYQEASSNAEESSNIRKQDLSSLFLDMFPLVWTKEVDETDPTFVRIYKSLSQLYKAIFENKNSGYLYDLTWEAINTALDDNHSKPLSVECCICILSFLIYNFNRINNYGDSTPIKTNIQNSNIVTLKQLLMLTNEINADTEITNYKEDYISRTSELIDSLTLKIKQSNHSDIAYFYIAIRYYIGMIDNPFDLQTKQKIALGMLDALQRLDNKYAEAFLDKFADLL